MGLKFAPEQLFIDQEVKADLRGSQAFAENLLDDLVEGQLVQLGTDVDLEGVGQLVVGQARREGGEDGLGDAAVDVVQLLLLLRQLVHEYICNL